MHKKKKMTPEQLVRAYISDLVGDYDHINNYALSDTLRSDLGLDESNVEGLIEDVRRERGRAGIILVQTKNVRTVKDLIQLLKTGTLHTKKSVSASEHVRYIIKDFLRPDEFGEDELPKLDVSLRDDLDLSEITIADIISELEKQRDLGPIIVDVGRVRTGLHLLELWEDGELEPSDDPTDYTVVVRRLHKAMNARNTDRQPWELYEVAELLKEAQQPPTLEYYAREDYERARLRVKGRPSWENLNLKDPYDAGMRAYAFDVARKTHPECVVATENDDE